MSDIQHFPKFSIVASGVRVSVDLRRFEQQFTDAQEWLGNQVLNDCKPFMPHLTGSLQQRSHTDRNGQEVVFPGPYGRFQYGGLVMVDPVTGSPWARPGAKKVITNRPLTYSAPGVTAQWFDTAKERHGDTWIRETKRRAGGG